MSASSKDEYSTTARSLLPEDSGLMNPTPDVLVTKKRVLRVQHDALADIVLGPLDRLALEWLPISVVLSYRGNLDSERLGNALEFTLHHYPALTGQLAWTIEGDPLIKQGESTVTYRVADCDADINDFLGDTSSLERFPDSGKPLCPALGNDLFAIQLTRFRSGYTIAIRVSHIVTDADGFTQFGLDLSKAYRTLTVGNVPQLASSVLEPHIPLPTSSSDDFTPPMYSLDRPHHGPRSSKVNTQVIRLDKDFLVALKQLAQPQHGWVSTFDALSAHLFQTIHRARVKTGVPLSPLDYFTAVNVRSRLSLPDRYFPMTTLDPYLTFESDTLLNAPLSEIATTMHGLTHSFSSEEAQETARWLQAHPKSHHRFRFGNGCFMTTKWSGFDLHHIIFDSEPARVSLPLDQAIAVDGLAYLLPTESEGTIDLYLSLDQAVWSMLKGGIKLAELPM